MGQLKLQVVNFGPAFSGAFFAILFNIDLRSIFKTLSFY